MIADCFAPPAAVGMCSSNATCLFVSLLHLGLSDETSTRRRQTETEGRREKKFPERNLMISIFCRFFSRLTFPSLSRFIILARSTSLSSSLSLVAAKHFASDKRDVLGKIEGVGVEVGRREGAKERNVNIKSSN